MCSSDLTGGARRVEHVGSGNTWRWQGSARLTCNGGFVGLVPWNGAIEHEPERDVRSGSDDLGRLIGLVLRGDEHLRSAVVDDVTQLAAGESARARGVHGTCVVATPHHLEVAVVILHTDGHMVAGLHACRSQKVTESIRRCIEFRKGLSEPTATHDDGWLVGVDVEKCTGIHVRERSRRYRRRMDPAEWFASLVRQPIESTHLDVFAGLIGVCFEPDNSVAEVAQRLDELAASVEPSFDSVMSLFSKGQFSGNSADYADPRNSYLHQVVRRGLGIPITLSVCAMEIGRRVGVPIYGVGLPGHFMVVCDGRYGDPFRGGALIDAHQLEEW